jgi:uncharacterized protein YbjT (DUF2867 family)
VKLILFGATGMVGQGVLREALAEPDVEVVLSVSRRSCGVAHPKLRELLISDLFEFAAHEPQLTGFNACIWALGISSVGLDEAAYSRVTEELTLLYARALLRLNPGLSFCYCSAMGADGRSMWARVRQRVERALKDMPFKHVGCVRPGFIRPGRGITHALLLYRVFLFFMRPFFPLLVWALPSLCTTSARLGRAMLRVVQGRAEGYILESKDINRVGRD